MVRGHFPLHGSSFIGRERELAEVRLALSHARLLTLTGPGGCGKTRLASSLAVELVPHYAHGVYWVELAPLSDSGLLPHAVATALGVHELPHEPLAQTLAQHLDARRALLVLDNCEHLIEACAHLASVLLATAEELQVLTTSRQPLGMPGETVWLVPPLSFPSPQSKVQSGVGRVELSTQDLGQYDAVRLFVERAAGARPGFTLTAENAAAVVEVCQRLDGLPLALELAAARVRVLTMTQIAARLDDRFNLLSRGNRTALLPRHQTLRAAIDWSYQLLSEPEQVLLRRLAVFAGSFTLAAAEAVCPGDERRTTHDESPLATPDRPSSSVLRRSAILDLLTGLVDKSLVVVADVREGREARYRLLETIREYAREKLLAAGDVDETHRQHAAYFFQLALTAETGFSDLHEAHWPRQLMEEQDNLLAALECLFGEGDATLRPRPGGAVRQASSGAAPPAQDMDALRMAIALGWFWNNRGLLSEGRRWLTRALEQTPQAPAALRAKALGEAGRIIHLQGDSALGRSLIEQALALARELADTRLMASALYALAGVCMSEDKPALAREFFTESLTLRRELGDRWDIARTLNALGEVARTQGMDEQALPLYHEAIAICRSLSHAHIVAMPLANVGYVLLRHGDAEGAVAPLAESLALAHADGNQILTGISLAGLAGVAVARQKAGEAARLLGAADSLFESTTIQIGRGDRALHAQITAAAQRVLNDEAFAAAYAEGQAMPLERAIRDALSLAAPGQPLARAQTRPELYIRALGTAEVMRAQPDPTPAIWSYAKSRELFFYLLCQSPRSREQIGLALWPDATSAQLRNRLSIALYRARRALGQPGWVVFEHEQYRFNRALPYWFDLEEFETHLGEAARLRAGEPAQAIGHLTQATELYRGDFLAGADLGDWVQPVREQVRQRFLEALLSLGQLHFAAGDYGRASELFRQAIATDGYLEAAHRELMRCYARLGERAQLQRHYQALTALLRDELGTTPAPQTAALLERLSRGLE